MAAFNEEHPEEAIRAGGTTALRAWDEAIDERKSKPNHPAPLDALRSDYQPPGPRTSEPRQPLAYELATNWPLVSYQFSY